jgi:hypothetical protein
MDLPWPQQLRGDRCGQSLNYITHNKISNATYLEKSSVSNYPRSAVLKIVVCIVVSQTEPCGMRSQTSKGRRALKAMRTIVSSSQQSWTQVNMAQYQQAMAHIDRWRILSLECPRNQYFVLDAPLRPRDAQKWSGRKVEPPKMTYPTSANRCIGDRQSDNLPCTVPTHNIACWVSVQTCIFDSCKLQGCPGSLPRKSQVSGTHTVLPESADFSFGFVHLHLAVPQEENGRADCDGPRAP